MWVETEKNGSYFVRNGYVSGEDVQCMGEKMDGVGENAA